MEKSNADIRMPCEVSDKLSEIAQKQGITRNALILNILWQYLEKK